MNTSGPRRRSRSGQYQQPAAYQQPGQYNQPGHFEQRPGQYERAAQYDRSYPYDGVNPNEQTAPQAVLGSPQAPYPPPQPPDFRISSAGPSRRPAALGKGEWEPLVNSITVPQAMRIGRARLTAGLDRFERIDLATHQEIFGPMRRVTARQLIEMVESVDLRGRGGAAFPFGRKVRAVVDSATARKCKPVILINGTEGEPGSAKDKMLLLRSPYLVLGGALLAARALGAKLIVVGVTNGDVASSVVEAAKAEPDLKKVVRVVEVPDRFVSGEGGALVNAVNGKIALPPGKKRRASDVGVDGLPTLLSNAETFAQLAVLAMLGQEGYASDGTPDEPGTLLLTVGGSAGRPAVVEVPAGIPLGTVLDICEATAREGILVGGYHGMWIPGELADEVPVSRAGLDAAGGALGAGIVLPLGGGTCPLGEVARHRPVPGQGVLRPVRAVQAGAARHRPVNERARGRLRRYGHSRHGPPRRLGGPRSRGLLTPGRRIQVRPVGAGRVQR